jgi:hypothetical protein
MWIKGRRFEPMLNCIVRVSFILIFLLLPRKKTDIY